MFFALLGSISLVAQNKSVTGKVTDEAGEPLPGVSVSVKGSTTGTATDFDGNYSLQNLKNGDVLEFRFVGFKPEERKLSGNQTKLVLNVVLKEEVNQLSDVVVTALGIKREQKALSYNTQTVNSEQLTTVKDANFVNSISGKVAGVTINRSSSGVGGATRVVMRGAKSIEKSNNALYVVDGVPLFSMTSKQGAGQFHSDGTTESIADINPDDIESMTVLTGASAAALYGSAAANGAILITTKKGKEGKMNVSFSSSAEYMQPFVMPEFQNTYGNDGRVESWGAKLPADFPKYDPKDFFATAYTLTNSFAVSGGTEKNQTYFSVASTDAQGLVPNNIYNRYNFTARNTTSLLQDRLRVDVGANYILQNNRNMVNQGQYMNPLVSAYLLPRGDGLEKTRVFEVYNPTRKIYEQQWGNFKANSNGLFEGTYSGDYTLQNPYWVAYRNLRDMKRERYILSLGLSYDIKKWSATEKWDISGRVRTDNTHFTATDKRYASTYATLDVSKNGFFGLSTGVERQTYADILTNFTRKYNSEKLGNFSFMLNLGASIQDSRKDMSYTKGPLRKNGVPNLFNTFNVDPTAEKTELGQEGWADQTQSVFGSLEVGYNNYLYLTLTGRNDWASQLANSPQSSFFYPSVGLSAVVTEMLSEDARVKLQSVLDFLKVRAAFSSVGSPFDRGLTTPTYTFDYKSKVWKTVSHFPVGALYPERTDSYEVGIASKWLKNRLSLDLTYYHTNTYNQTIKAGISASSGYDAIYLQTGDVQNQGIELGLGFNAGDREKGFFWDSYFTLGYNKNEIKSLAESYINPVTGVAEGKDQLPKGGLGSLKYILKTGGTLGDIYTDQDFRRDSDGRIYVDANNNVFTQNFANGEMKKMGSVLPDYNLGWRNDFSVGRFGFGAMLSGRIGGVVVSMTEAALDNYGVSKATADARDAGGVDINGVKINAKNYYQVRGNNRLAQYYLYSATNFRLQEAYVSYTLPRKALAGKMDLTLSLVGRNLAMLYCKAPFDPESVSSTENYAQGLDYFMLPSLRSFGLSVKANF